MRLFVFILCFVAAAWAEKNQSAPIAKNLHMGDFPFFPYYPPGFYPGPPYRPGGRPVNNLCWTYRAPLYSCLMGCQSDRDCQGGKCCFDRCSSKCVSPPPPTTTPAPTTAAAPAPTTPTPAPTTTPPRLCPASPGVERCRQLCPFPCLRPSCQHCRITCSRYNPCPSPQLCCLDTLCNIVCTNPVNGVNIRFSVCHYKCSLDNERELLLCECI